MPTLYVVASPNGCGKSTLTRTVWRGDFEIIDPDEIARHLPGRPGQAAREAVRRRRAALRAGEMHLLDYAAFSIAERPGPKPLIHIVLITLLVNIISFANN